MTREVEYRRPVRRGAALLIIVGLLVAGGIVDRRTRPAARLGAGRPFAMPVASPASALSSTWYCSGGSAQPNGPADAYVVIANPARHDLTATLTIIPNEGERVSRSVDVPALARTTFRLLDAVRAPFAAAVVELDGGEAVVEQTVNGQLGTSMAPCSPAASDRWYFADGATTRDATLYLALFNPFPDNAIADLTFATDQGRAVPSALQGLVVPGRSLVVKSINDFVRRREFIAGSIAVRSGRLIVHKLQLHNGGGRKGMALALAAPATGDRWSFAEGFVQDGVTERVAVYNPGEQEARVDVEFALEQGAAEPFELTVPARERVTLVVNEEARIPKGDPHAITVIRRTGPNVVAERTIDAIPPSSRTGFADTLGSRRTARTWLLAAGAATSLIDQWVVVENPGRRAVQLSMTVLAGGQPLAIDGLQDVSVGAGRRQAFRIGDHIERADLSLVVEATGPVLVERTLYRVNGLGISATIGIPAG
jgi:hypothetical protein